VNIFLTNDDGVESPGIRVLEAAFRGAGHNTLVLAPDRDRSGASQSISLRRPFGIREVEDGVWSCGGTPADCVIVGLAGALPGHPPFRPDAVVSGINAGENIGTDLLFSATAAAARQAVVFGVPAIALSLTGRPPFAFEAPAAWSVKHLDELLALWTPDIFVNVNFPHPRPGDPAGFLGSLLGDTVPLDEAGVERCFPARRVYQDTAAFAPLPGGGYECAMVLGDVESEAAPGSDMDAVRRGRIALSLVLVQPQTAGERPPPR